MEMQRIDEHFTVYSILTHDKIVEIDGDEIYIAPAFAEQLKKILTYTCFIDNQPDKRREIFGTVTEVQEGDLLYPKALKMYCEAQLLARQPDLFTRHPNNI